LLQSCAKGCDQALACQIGFGEIHKHADAARPFRRLRLRGERPSRRCSNYSGYEIASPHTLLSAHDYADIRQQLAPAQEVPRSGCDAKFLSRPAHLEYPATVTL
jgi:hypothetical protein